MSQIQFLILALVALIVTVPTIKFIPRARQSPVFDRVLWGATWLLAFLCAWYAVGQLKSDAPLASLELDAFAQVAGASIILGALGGALSLNVVLWLIDRVNPLSAEEAPDAQDSSDRVEDETSAPTET
ncbi:MAG: hypothetical protein L0Y55_09055 [Anaerolineales bacterium]|nr:hypothetical protein [Anaerolineales bacterium]